jgi:hypothetical protein
MTFTELIKYVYKKFKKLEFQICCLQNSTLVEGSNFIGGQSAFTADGVTTVFNITHNLGAIPSFFTLTTTAPIASNHLNRTITFPDVNTMRITFNVAPSIGENANYVWIVFK